MNRLTGERVLGIAFAAAGLIFAFKARELNYMGEFAPGAGFLPFWLGLALAALAIGFLFTTRTPQAEQRVDSTSGRKVVAVSAGLIACVALLEWCGFAVALFAYLVYLVRGVERRGRAFSIALALGTTLALELVFGVWLGVPLPRGPWGF